MGSQFSLATRPAAATDSQSSSSSQTPFRSRAEAERERALAPVVRSNRAQPAGLPASYTVAPRSTFDGTRAGQPDHRPIGAGGLEAFRRMTQKNKGRRG
jgi:transcription factor SPN1